MDRGSFVRHIISGWIIEEKAEIKKGGIFMRQNSNETAGNMISMEEYLKKRQAMTPPAARWQTEGKEEPVTALKLAELLYV